jgi:hypothetical protein
MQSVFPEFEKSITKSGAWFHAPLFVPDRISFSALLNRFTFLLARSKSIRSAA